MAVMKVLGKSADTWRAEMASWSNDGVVEELDYTITNSWQLDASTQFLLSAVGLPSWGSLFVRDPQGPGEPRLSPYYVIGRETVEQHSHGSPIDVNCGCGYFGVSEDDGSVWQVFPGHAKIPVNSNLPLFYYFLNKVCGAWPRQDDDLPERAAVRRAEGVMRRLVQRDPILASGVESFWGYLFARPWG
jgi:hypothetical protein